MRCGTRTTSGPGGVKEHAVRYSREHKQAMRQRIIEAAGRQFKTDGIDGSGIAADGGRGADQRRLIRPFDSKDDLVATTVAHQLHAQWESVGVLPPGRAGVEHIVREYLSVQHRDDPVQACPSATLLDEIGRCADATQTGVHRRRAGGHRRLRRPPGAA